MADPDPVEPMDAASDGGEEKLIYESLSSPEPQSQMETSEKNPNCPQGPIHVTSGEEEMVEEGNGKEKEKDSEAGENDELVELQEEVEEEEVEENTDDEDEHFEQELEDEEGSEVDDDKYEDVMEKRIRKEEEQEQVNRIMSFMAKSWTGRKLGKNVQYLVSQSVEGGVVLAKIEQINRYPFFVFLADDYAEEEFGMKPKTGDKIFVEKFEWYPNKRFLAEEEYQISENRYLWFNENTGRLSIQAKALRVTKITRIEAKEWVGSIIYMKINRAGKIAYVDVISAGLAKAARVHFRQIEEMPDLKIGDIIKIEVITHKNYLVDSSYLLPRQFPFKFGMEAICGEAGGALAAVVEKVPWPKETIFPLDPDYTLEQLRTAEHIIAAAIKFEMELKMKDLIDARFACVPESVDNIHQEFMWIEFFGKRREEIVKLAEAWEIDTPVEIKYRLTEPPFMRGIVAECYADEGFFNIKIKLLRSRTDNQIKRRKFFSALEWRERRSIVCHPVLDRGISGRFDAFKYNFPSNLMNEGPRGDILKALLGRRMDREAYEMQMTDADDQAADTQRLNQRQQATARLMQDSGRVVLQRAPPGTGKTKVAAEVVAQELQKGETMIALLATANIPITKLAQETISVIGRERLENVNAVALFSGAAKVKYGNEIQSVEQLTLGEKFSDDFCGGCTEDEKKEVYKYIENVRVSPRFTGELGMGRFFVNKAGSKLVMATIAMTENMLNTGLGGKLARTETLIIDEATAAKFSAVVHLITEMPNLKKLLLTGDEKQLGVHTLSLPDILHANYGLESVVAQAMASPSTDKTFLTRAYRSHPALTNCISSASYKEQPLVPAILPTQRQMLTNSNFPLPVQQIPIVLIQAPGQAVRDQVTSSWHNHHQMECALFILEALRHTFGPQVGENTVILCLYTSQAEEVKREIKRLEWEAKVLTVDSFQAQEANIVILITTKTPILSQTGDGLDFFRDNKRATVALSRAKEALFVIGDLLAVAEGEVYREYFKAAMALTPVMKEQYVMHMGERGQLDALIDREFTREWNNKFGDNFPALPNYRQQERAPTVDRGRKRQQQSPPDQPARFFNFAAAVARTAHDDHPRPSTSQQALSYRAGGDDRQSMGTDDRQGSSNQQWRHQGQYRPVQQLHSSNNRQSGGQGTSTQQQQAGISGEQSSGHGHSEDQQGTYRQWHANPRGGSGRGNDGRGQRGRGYFGNPKSQRRN